MQRVRMAGLVVLVALGLGGLVAQAAGANPDVPLPDNGEEPEPIHVPKTGPDGRLVPLTVPPWLGPVPGEEVMPRDRDRIQEEVDLVEDLMREGAIDNWSEAEDYIQDLLDLLDELGRDEAAEPGEDRPMTLWCYWRPADWWACAP